MNNKVFYYSYYKKNDLNKVYYLWIIHKILYINVTKYNKY